ncbi:SDR family NAD(P)-dependent oxidoreductase [Pirellulales bacterium]|nr:SDR family NAD(P)-dependent oxidoreductase [Pirellulales bacterium]
MPLNPMSLEGKSVLVTGASSGIGRATSVLLARLGAKVVLVARDATRLEETARLLESDAYRIESFDLTAFDEIPGWMKSVAAEEGPLHGLVHSAGVHATRPLRMMTSENIAAMMGIHVTASAMLARGFRQKGVRADAGSIVFLSSVMALVGQPAVSAYSASKGAMKSLAASLALELAREGIRVNCVAPGQVKTEMSDALHGSLPDDKAAEIDALHPLGSGRPIDVAHAIAFLLAETGRWITGTTLVVDGGYTAQ